MKKNSFLQGTLIASFAIIFIVRNEIRIVENSIVTTMFFVLLFIIPPKI